MKYDPLISVIVPVYNTSNYLRQCLDSICAQTYKNLEIICVNDGSTDNSADILSEYAARDERIVVVHQKNAGLSAARNTALEAAKGQWVAAVDSDDYLLPETFELCARHTSDNRIDLIRYNIEDFRDDVPECIIDSPWLKPVADGTVAITEDIILKQNVAFCGKIWRLDSLRSLNAKFPVGLLYEDQYFWFAVLPCCRYMHFETSNKAAYRYRRRADSIIGSSTSQSNSRILEILKIVELNLENFKKLEVRKRFGYSSDCPSRLEIEMLENTYKNILRWCPDSLLQASWYKYREIIEKNNYQKTGIDHTLLLLFYHIPPKIVKQFNYYELTKVLKAHKLKHTIFESLAKNEMMAISLYKQLVRNRRILSIKHFLTWGKRKKEYRNELRKTQLLLNVIRSYRAQKAAE